MACIMDCPTITVHAGKHYRALIDSRAAISLLCYSSYQHIDDSFKTPIQHTTAKLNTTNGSLSFRYDSFTFMDSRFQIYPQLCDCDRLPDTEIIFVIDIQKTF